MNTTSEEAKSNEMISLKLEKYLKPAQLGLRLLAMAATLAATWIIITNKETVVVYGITADAKFTYSPASKFFAVANIIACVFSAISLLGAYFLSRNASKFSDFSFVFFLHDLTVMTLLMAACAAATAVGYVGKYGNPHAGWMAFCGYFDRYCDRVTASLTLSYIGCLFYFFLTIISASKCTSPFK